MIRLLRWLIWGDAHMHKWAIIHSTKVFEKADDPLPVRQVALLQCEICGNLKRERAQ